MKSSTTYRYTGSMTIEEDIGCYDLDVVIEYRSEFDWDEGPYVEILSIDSETTELTEKELIGMAVDDEDLTDSLIRNALEYEFDFYVNGG